MKVPDYFPEGGWTDDNFRTPAGLKLLRDQVSIQTRWKKHGIKSLAAMLDRHTKTLFADIFRDVLNGYSAREGKHVAIFEKASATLNPVGDSHLWANAMNNAFEKFNINATADAGPIVEQQSTGIQSDVTTVVGGRRPTKTEISRMKPRARNLAAKVKNVSETTRTKLAKEIQRAIDDRLTIPETVKRLRKRVPQIAANRIPTIARTEMGNAADQINIDTLQEMQVVSHVSVVGCQAIEASAPTHNGVPTCNIQDVPIEEADLLTFHPNHTGLIISSRFREREPTSADGDAPPPKKPPKPKPIAPAKPSSGTGIPDEIIPEVIPDVPAVPAHPVALEVEQIRKNLIKQDKRLKKMQVQLEKQNNKRGKLYSDAHAAGFDTPAGKTLAKQSNRATASYHKMRAKYELERAKLQDITAVGERSGDFSNVKVSLRATDGHGKQVKSIYMDAIAWLERQMPKGTVRYNKIKLQGTKTRSNFDADKWRANADNLDAGKINFDQTKMSKSTMVHELIHSIENSNVAMFRNGYNFLKRRAKGKKLMQMKTKYNDYDFKQSEIFMEGAAKPIPKVPDELKLFTNSRHAAVEADYANKIYSVKMGHNPKRYVGKKMPDFDVNDIYGSETMTVGVEQLFKNPVEFALRDPEYFRFVLANLRGHYVDNAVLRAARLAAKLYSTT
mgnify:CR=1 FL=1